MNPEKKAARQAKNKAAKIVKAAARQAHLATLGKLVIEKTVAIDIEAGEGVVTKTVPDFPPFIATTADGSIKPFYNQPQSFSKLAFIGAKTYKQQGLSMKNRPGNKELHGQAVVEDASRTFAKEVDKAMTPVAEETPIPVVPENAAQQAAQL
jgi:hypothetical protein